MPRQPGYPSSRHAASRHTRRATSPLHRSHRANTPKAATRLHPRSPGSAVKKTHRKTRARPHGPSRANAPRQSPNPPATETPLSPALPTLHPQPRNSPTNRHSARTRDRQCDVDPPRLSADQSLPPCAPQSSPARPIRYETCNPSRHPPSTAIRLRSRCVPLRAESVSQPRCRGVPDSQAATRSSAEPPASSYR